MMISRVLPVLVLAAAVVVPTMAEARFSFSVGDTVWSEGRMFTREEYEKYKAEHPDDGSAPQAQPAPAPQPAASQPNAQSAAAPGVAPAGVPRAIAATPVLAPTLRAASCKTKGYYREFPNDTEKFVCSSGLGAMSRGEMLNQGWKIDLIEKLPADDDQPNGPSAYKIILSR